METAGQQHNTVATGGAQTHTFALSRPVVLVGFMGAGKTSVARRMARNLGLVSIDTDTYFAHDLGISTGDFIREYGEAAFREQETAVLRELLGRDAAIISCGGGIVERPENRALLADQFVVYLRVSADDARARISSLQSRPLFGDMEQARALNDRREPLYREVADAVIEAGGRPVARLAAELQRLCEERGVLCPVQR